LVTGVIFKLPGEDHVVSTIMTVQCTSCSIGVARFFRAGCALFLPQIIMTLSSHRPNN